MVNNVIKMGRQKCPEGVKTQNYSNLTSLGWKIFPGEWDKNYTKDSVQTLDEKYLPNKDRLKNRRIKI